MVSLNIENEIKNNQEILAVRLQKSNTSNLQVKKHIKVKLH
jgi:hypothetical protein